MQLHEAAAATFSAVGAAVIHIPMTINCGALLQVMYDGDMRELLPKIRCPALVVVGEKDFRYKFDI